jgi:rubrerythrin
MSDNNTVGHLFELAIQVEKAAESLYRGMGQMFAQEPDVANFWRKYADEEKGHAAFLERTRDRMAAEALSAPADDHMLKSVHKSQEVSVDHLLQNVKTLDDAYQIAMDLENSETNTIFEFMVTNFSTEELVKSQGFLRVQLNKHIVMLTDEFPTKFKSRLMRQGLKAPEITQA